MPPSRLRMCPCPPSAPLRPGRTGSGASREAPEANGSGGRADHLDDDGVLRARRATELDGRSGRGGNHVEVVAAHGWVGRVGRAVVADVDLAEAVAIEDLEAR